MLNKPADDDSTEVAEVAPMYLQVGGHAWLGNVKETRVSV